MKVKKVRKLKCRNKLTYINLTRIIEKSLPPITDEMMNYINFELDRAWYNGGISFPMKQVKESKGIKK